MKNKNLMFMLTGFAVAGLLVLLQVLFIVREGDAAVVTTFGKPTRDLTEPGPYFRWPWPIQRVYRFDKRVQCFEGPYEQILTRDGKNLLVSLYVGWHIMEPTPFLERVGTMEQAERNLEGLLRNYTSATLGRYAFSALVNVQEEALRFEDIEKEIMDAVQAEAESRYGIHVEYLGIRRVGLPESITTRVFERMRAERTELSERYRSEGEGEALRIRAEADSDREQTLARAEAEAKRIRAEGEAMAAEAYRVFAQDPQLAIFLRKLDVMQEVMTNRTTLILGTDASPFDLLQGPLKLD